MKKIIMLPVTLTFCDICNSLLGQKSGDTIIYEPRNPIARVETCIPCAKKRGYIS